MAPEQPSEADYQAARAALEARLRQARNRNQKKYRAIVSQGATPGAASILAARLEALLMMLLSDDARLAFEVEFEERLTSVFDECLADLRQATLAKPVSSHPSGLIMPG